MNKIVQGWFVALVMFGAGAVLVGWRFGPEAGKFFFIGAAAVIVASMVTVGFKKKEKDDVD